MKVLKKGWIRIDKQLFNLKMFSKIERGVFRTLEAEGLSFYIKVIELDKAEDGSEKSFMIATYKENEKDLWESDFNEIESVLDL